MTDFLDTLTAVWCVFGFFYVLTTIIIPLVAYTDRNKMSLVGILACVPGWLLAAASLVVVLFYNYNKYMVGRHVCYLVQKIGGN